jgi:hypothetical protein
MSVDAPVNTGAAWWPDLDSAYFAVRRMQTKLHQWAGKDLSRRFGDLCNLVYDPAFLVHAWERVSTDKGAKTAGVDQQWHQEMGGDYQRAKRRRNGQGIRATGTTPRLCARRWRSYSPPWG